MAAGGPDQDGEDRAERDERARAEAEECGAVGGGALGRDGEHVAVGEADVAGDLGGLSAAAGIVHDDIVQFANNMLEDA